MTDQWNADEPEDINDWGSPDDPNIALKFPEGDDTPLEQIARDGNFDEQRLATLPDEVVFNNVSVPAASVQATDLGRFEGKQTTGPYDKDSDTTQSAWIQDTWSGGQLINKHIPGGTDSRFRSAKAWTLNSQQLSLPPLVEKSQPYGMVYDGADLGSFERPNVFNASCPLGEFNDAMWYAIGSQLFKVTTIPNAFDDVELTPVASLMYPPVAIGAVYGPPLADHSLEERRPRLWVPLGNMGIQNIRDTDNISPLEPDIKAIALKSWDRSLWALTTDGYLRQYVQWDSDYQGEWREATSEMKLPRDQRPMGLDIFYDRAGNQTLYLITDKQMWAYDPNTFSLVATQLERPKHPDNGWGFNNWRDDAIYSTAGIGVDRYSRDGVRTQVGPDRDDSIDITELGNPYPTVGTTGAPFISQYTRYKADNTPDGLAKGMVAPTVPFIASSTTSLNYLLMGMGRGVYQQEDGSTISRMSVELWNEAGWHTLADLEVKTNGCFLTPGPMVMSETVGGYRLWMGMMAWGTDMNVNDGPETPIGSALSDYEGQIGIVSIQLPRHAHGPRQLISKNVGRFESTGYLKTGWFNSGMDGFDKLNSHHEIYLSRPEGYTGDFPESAYVDVLYRVLESPNEWLHLGRAQKFGKSVMPFGIRPEDGFPAGHDSQSIEFWYQFFSDDETFSPIIEATVLKYIKIPLPGRAWLITVPLSYANENGNGPNEVDDYLSKLTTSNRFIPMVHQGSRFRSRVAQHQMIEGTGRDLPFRNATVNVVDVPIPDYPWPLVTDDDDGTESV